MNTFTFELARRLAGTGVTANCLDPGALAGPYWIACRWYRWPDPRRLALPRRILICAARCAMLGHGPSLTAGTAWRPPCAPGSCQTRPARTVPRSGSHGSFPKANPPGTGGSIDLSLARKVEHGRRIWIDDQEIRKGEAVPVYARAVTDRSQGRLYRSGRRPSICI